MRNSLLLFVSLCLCGSIANAQTPKKIWEGVYTNAQATRGKAEFDQTCSRCHNLALIGSERGPAIKGATFLSHWEKGSVADIFIKIRDTMPEGNAGTVNEDIKLDILTYILQQNGAPSGTMELTKNLSSLEDIRMSKKGIWDGIYTTAQADRGKAALSQNGCNGCHGPELAGDRGPSLKGDRFITAWENGSVNRLFTKIRDTMPPLNAEQVTASTKVDIIAYLLSVNGFPAGNSELPIDSSSLDNLQIIRKGAESSGPPNFALVQVTGCLTQTENGRWSLTNASDPIATKEESGTGATLPLGKSTFDLVSIAPTFKPETHRGHKMDARGLLYKDTSYAEINLTSLSMIGAACN